jgi:phosphoglycerate dehydrogenase-like enzyme
VSKQRIEPNDASSAPWVGDQPPGDFTIVYGEPIPNDLRAIAADLVPAGFRLLVVSSRDREELLRLMPGADFLLVATARVDEELLRAAPRLRLVQHQGVGYDNIDVDACRRSAIPVALTPEGTTIGVAEHTVLLILALFRHLITVDAAVRRGEWPVWSMRSRSVELAGKTVGLIGFGRIGREVARRARAFDTTIVYHDAVRAPAPVEAELGATSVSRDDLLRQADVVSLHAPLTAETRGMIGERELRLMPPHAVLINTARGALVDEPALVRALAEEWIAGAGLDVLVQEPPDAGNPLLTCPNMILTPHVAAGTRDAYRTKMHAVFANMQRVARGEAPLNQVS